jgi:ABC-type branched-subunit amino acid transport system substrate-binding protein
VQEERVDVLIGTAGTPGTVAIAVVAAETKTPMISLTPATAPTNPNGQMVAKSTTSSGADREAAADAGGMGAT